LRPSVKRAQIAQGGGGDGQAGEVDDPSVGKQPNAERTEAARLDYQESSEGDQHSIREALVDESRRTLRLVDAAARIHTPRNISQRATYTSHCSTKKDTKRDWAKFRPPECSNRAFRNEAAGSPCYGIFYVARAPSA
jgi:hypothetical protein